MVHRGHPGNFDCHGRARVFPCTRRRRHGRHDAAPHGQAHAQSQGAHRSHRASDAVPRSFRLGEARDDKPEEFSRHAQGRSPRGSGRAGVQPCHSISGHAFFCRLRASRSACIAGLLYGHAASRADQRQLCCVQYDTAAASGRFARAHGILAGALGVWNATRSSSSSC